jgi:hypothetical protein
MDSDIEEEIIQKHNQAEVLISLFFAAVDIIGYLIILFKFGCGFKKICSPIQKLYCLIILDGVIRIINLEITSFVYSFPKEILMSFFATIQFYLIISIISAIYEDKRNQNFSAGDMGIRDKPLLVLTFFFCSIVFVFSKVVSLIQYIGCIFAVCGFGFYINKKTFLFLDGISKKNQNFTSRNFIQNSVSFVGFYFFVHYAVKIYSLFVENPLYCSYIQMAYDVFKEIGKYLTFTFVSIIYYLYNKYVYLEDVDFQNEPQTQSAGVF